MGWTKLEMPSAQEVAEFLTQHKKRVRFLVDECLGEGTVELIRAAGWNVKGVWELGLVGRDDSDVVACAWREKRTLLTHDQHFLDDGRFPEHRNPGIFVLPGGAGGEAVLIRALGQMLSLVGGFPDIYTQAKMRLSEDGTFLVTARDPNTGRMRTSRYRFPKHGAPLFYGRRDREMNEGWGLALTLPVNSTLHALSDGNLKLRPRPCHDQ